MSDLSRLREIAALLRPATPVIEAKIPQGFEGIKRVVDDALADLHDKLAEGGALETMLDQHNLSDMAEKTIESLAKALEVFKKEVEAGLTEAEAMIHMVDESLDPEPVMEMAKARSYRGGAFNRKQAKLMIRAFKEDGETFELENGDKYEFDKPTNGGSLKRGDIVFAVHDKYNTGAELYEVLGFGKNDKIEFDTIKDALKARGVTSLKALEKFNTDNGDKEVRLIVKDLDSGDSGDWFYLFEGRWAYGSGGEPLSFSLVKKVA